MQFLLLIYTDESKDATATPEELNATMEDYNAFTAEVRDRTVASDALLPTNTAKSVRIRDGQTIVTDGPFAETKEQLGGYYQVEAETIEEAVAIAAKIPGAKVGTIEVRPIMVFE